LKIKFIVLGLCLALFALPVLAQDSANAITFNNFSFSFDSSLASNVNITQFPGDPPDLEQPGGPEVAHTQFVLYTTPPAPESYFDAPIAIRVYRTADFGPYEFPSQQLQQLQTLLAERPDLAEFMVVPAEGTPGNSLPFMPVMPASQAIRAQAHYVETAGTQGVSYVTVFRQDVSPFTGDEFMYTYQGLSNDGAYYVSMVAQLSTDLFPAEIPADFDYDAFTATFTEYLTESVATLNAASPDDFTPSLTALDALAQTFTFTSAGDAAPAPVPTATSVPSDLGGLDDATWTLVSYGPADAPVAVLPNAPITLTFSAEGISGSAGCNQYFGGFEFDQSAITFSAIGSTMMACEQPIMDQETAYLGALQSATAYQITDGQLQITYNGGVLTFTAAGGTAPGSDGTEGASGAGELDGVTWTLVSYGPADAPVAVLPNAPITLVFSEGGVSGSAGCNQYFGTFDFDDSAITISGVGSTMMACEQPVMDQETAYLSALQSATAYQVTDGQLQITYNGGVLTFTAS
jgi:heat shock protein HslJ